MTELVATGEHRLEVSASPHVAQSMSARAIMLWVAGAAAPAAIWALGTEAVWNAIAKREQTLMDGSALVTGLLLALAMPTRTPWWMALAAGFVAIALGKMIFGGLGFNMFNPALVGRAFVLMSWAGLMAEQVNRGWFSTVSLAAKGNLDAVNGATRLALASADRAANGAYTYDLQAQYGPLLFKNVAGSLGEVSAALLILGGLVLIAKGIIDWRIPAGYIGTMGVLSWAFGSDPIFNVLAGGVLLGAFFMATDYVSSPVNKNARLVYGIGCGLLNAVGRFFGPMPETTTFAILFMNGLAPLIDRMMMPRTFGWVKGDA